MADAYRDTQQESPDQRAGPDHQNIRRQLQQAGKRFAPLATLWKKSNNDGIFNSAATLAYTFLVSLFPLFLVILAIAGFLLRAVSPANLTKLQNTLAGGLPGGTNGTGGQIVDGVLRQLNQSAGILLLIGIVGALIAGSGLFLTLESAFDITFRLKSRDPVPQRIMAVSMVLLYVVLVPIMVFASILPSAILKALQIGTHNPGGAFLIQLLGLFVAFGSGCLLFGAIYYIVPNRRMSVVEIGKGTLAAAALLVVYEVAFPIYESVFLHPNRYGSLVGFSIVILTFFYYLGFIVLLGAEINSMAMGLRPTTKPLNAILLELQEHNLMIEPAESAATSQDVSQGASTAKMQEEHKRPDALSQDGAAEALAAPSRGINHPSLPPRTKRQQAALAAVVVTSAIAVVPVLRAGKRLMLGDVE